MTAAEIAAPQAREPGRGPPSVGGWRLWLLIAATFSLYAMVWAYRVGRALRDEGRTKLRPGWWAVLVMGALPQPFVLHNVATHARQRSRERGLEPQVSPYLVAGVSLAIQVALLASLRLPALHPLSLVATLLLPLPFVWVQRELDRTQDASASARHFSWPARLAVGVGVVVAGLAVLGGYADGTFERLLGRSLPVGEPVGSPGWSISPDVTGWVRVPAGRFGDETSELELAGPGGDSWLVVYVTARPPSDLDALAAQRASALVEVAPPTSLQERRFLFPGLDLAPASRMRLATSDWQRGVYHVLIVSGGERSIELVGYAPRRRERDVHTLVESLKLAPDGAFR